MRLSSHWSLYISALLLLLAVTACEGPPGPAGPPGPPGPIGPAGTKGLAAVGVDGTLLRGVNVVSAGFKDPGYLVTFTEDVDVANGYYLATPGLTSTCNATVRATGRQGNSVFVGFSLPDHTYVKCAFSLAVF